MNHHAHLESGEFVATTPAHHVTAELDAFVEIVREHNAQAAMIRNSDEEKERRDTLRSPKPNTAHKLVLVVDDDRELCELIRDALEKHMFRVHVEYEGTEALEWMRGDILLSQYLDASNPRVPSLILVDWELPAKSAFGFVHALQTNTITRAVDVGILSSTPSDTPWVLHLEAENFDEEKLLSFVRTHTADPVDDG